MIIMIMPSSNEYRIFIISLFSLMIFNPIQIIQTNPVIVDMDQLNQLIDDDSMMLENPQILPPQSTIPYINEQQDEIGVIIPPTLATTAKENDLFNADTLPSSSSSSSSFMDNMMMLATQNITENIVQLNPKDCIFVKTEEGIYTLTSEDESNLVCGLYLMASPTQFVEIEFLQFDVSCHKNGLLSVVDGWELMGQFFPSVEDHPIPRDARYHEFCGHVKPKKIFRMSQNVGLIEYRIPNVGQGFTVRVRFVENPKPCNTIIQGVNYGIYTLRNYGRRINCTMSILFSASFRILSMNVGQSYRRLDSMIHSPKNYVAETGVIKKCKKRGMNDYVEFRGGQGLDTQLMQIGDDVCGFRPFPHKKRFTVMCTNTAVRLVSSGQYDNQIEFGYEPMLDLEPPSQQPASLICPINLQDQ
uniref:Corticotropin-releasing factor-binding protein n=2 Tax=Dermatophagoides pteronyssinus TaxID=6956 RepID=A0A6P6YD37_DERPT|nr:corticotropin-releasing factor-binding protein-like [Dermatophagoides pteronyssinus]